MKIVNTNNYDKFKFVKWNREIDWKHVERLKTSIKVHGQLEEIQCTSDYKILDGQHRFHALRELEMPVQAILKKNAKEEDLHEMNDVRKGWTTLDSLNEYCKKQISDYLQLSQKIEYYKDVFNVSSIIYAYDHSVYHKKKDFTNGKYRFSEIKGNSILRNCLKMSEVIGNNAYKSKFIKCITILMSRNKRFDINRLHHVAQTKKLYIYANEYDTLNEIIEIYNYKLKNEEKRIS
jgi:hypothetical protein